MNLLEMQHVKKGFGENEVLKDISLSVAEGEVVSIIGPSGSGKSTLLRCATLLERKLNVYGGKGGREYQWKNGLCETGRFEKDTETFWTGIPEF